MKLTLLGAGELARALPMSVAIDALAVTFARFGRGEVEQPERSALDIRPTDGPGGTALVMPAWVPGVGLGTKLVTVFPENRAHGLAAIHGLVVLADERTGVPTALVDGAWLTAWRTAAVTALATRFLARKEADVAAVFGAGVQARTQILGLEAVRSLREVRVFAPRAEATRDFIERVQPQVQTRLVAVRSPAEALDGAGIVTCATSSPVPVFGGEQLAAGTHVNAVGSFTLATRELDATTVGRARVFVDALSAALAEAGELVAAEREGVTRRADWIELGRLVLAPELGRRTNDEVTLFKSVGLALQDIATASAAFQRARELGLGREVEL